MIWRFNDGTTAHLGGEIEGASLFAAELREDLLQPRVGVQLQPGPGGGVWLDRNNAALFDAWLRQEMERPWRAELELKLLEAPKNLPPLPKIKRMKAPPDALE